jgi:hypothetical protein
MGEFISLTKLEPSNGDHRRGPEEDQESTTQNSSQVLLPKRHTNWIKIDVENMKILPPVHMASSHVPYTFQPDVLLVDCISQDSLTCVCEGRAPHRGPETFVRGNGSSSAAMCGSDVRE